MAIFFMHGKTFLKEYIQEDPEKVLRTQFILVSSHIRKSNKYESQVIKASFLYPSTEIILEYDDEEYKTNQQYISDYFGEIQEHKSFFATLIKYALEENYTIVFLCGYDERKYNFLKMIQMYVDEEFNYHIYDYKKFKNGKEPVVKYDDINSILMHCNKILKNAKKERRQKLLSNKNTREKFIDEMSKKKMVDELKDRDLYYDGMSKSEMKDMLDTFL